MGVTWHNNSLYVQGGRLEEPFTETLDNPGFGRQSGQAGLHRLRDIKGDGSFTMVDTLRTWDGPEGGHSDHGVHHREWFNRVNQQPRIAGNAPYLNQVRIAALATLTDAEKADQELSTILAAYKPPAGGRGRGAPVPDNPPAGGRGGRR
jgi:hypothetical protein